MVWNANLPTTYFLNIFNLTYHSNQNYERLAFQITNLESLDNYPWVSTACRCPHESNAQYLVILSQTIVFRKSFHVSEGIKSLMVSLDKYILAGFGMFPESQFDILLSLPIG